MAKRLPEIQLLLPYQSIEELLHVAKEVKELRAENAMLKKQILVPRCTQQECLEKIKKIERYLRSDL